MGGKTPTEQVVRELEAARQRIIDLEAALAEVSVRADDMTAFANRCGPTLRVGEFHRRAGKIKDVCMWALKQKE